MCGLCPNPNCERKYGPQGASGPNRRVWQARELMDREMSSHEGDRMEHRGHARCLPTTSACAISLKSAKARQDPTSCLAGSLDHAGKRGHPQGREYFGNAGQFTRRIALPTAPDRGNIGCIRLQHQRRQRKFARQRPDAQGPGVGHGTADPQRKAKTGVGICLLQTPIECVRNATANPVLAQTRQNWILGTADMQNDRQFKRTGHAQLRLQKTLLADPIQSRNKMVEADFTHRHQPRIFSGRLEGLVQALQIRIQRSVHIHRMDPQGIRPPWDPMRECPDGCEIRGLDRWNHDPGHPSPLGLVNDDIPVRIKFSGVEMTMRVDQHAQPLLRLDLLIGINGNQEIVRNS